MPRAPVAPLLCFAFSPRGENVVDPVSPEETHHTSHARHGNVWWWLVVVVALAPKQQSHAIGKQ